MCEGLWLCVSISVRVGKCVYEVVWLCVSMCVCGFVSVCEWL